MKMIERTPYQGDEIQLFEITYDELMYFNDRDNAARRWAIVKYYVQRLFNAFFFMKNNHNFVGSLARARVVETLVANVCHRPAAELGDLVQMVYDILLHKSPRELQRVVKNRAVNYYIVAIIKNLYFSKTSPYYRKIRRPGQHDEMPQDGGSHGESEEDAEECQRAVAALPPDERALFLLYVDAGGIRQLARRLDIPQSTLQYRIAKIRKKLRDQITSTLIHENPHRSL